MKELVIQLLLAHKDMLGTVRAISGLQVALAHEWIWVRGIKAKGPAELKIQQLPSQHTFEMDEQGNLFPLKGLTPVGKLQNLTWMPIAEFITVELPTSAMPGKVSQQYKVVLVPSTQIKPGEGLVTTLSLWKNYAITAAEVRLNRLHFALSQTGKVLILGTPLPAIPGKEYWLQENILLPAGFNFEIPLITHLIAGKLNPLNDSFILFEEDSRWQRIFKSCFVPATRSAVRLSGGEKLT